MMSCVMITALSSKVVDVACGKQAEEIKDAFYVTTPGIFSRNKTRKRSGPSFELPYRKLSFFYVQEK